MKKSKYLVSFFLILLTSACSLIPINPPPPTETVAPVPTNTPPPLTISPENLPIDTTTVSQQGRIDFHYKTADAGNFILQAGENIAFTWLNFPPGAAFYTIAVKPDSEDQRFIIGTDFDDADGVKVDWNVQEDLGGTLVGFACFEDGSCIGSEWSGAIYSGALPPEEYCSVKLFSMGTVDIYLEPDQNSPVMGYMIPGKYSQVYAISQNQWLSIDLANHEYAAESYRSITTGYVLLQESIELFGPCDSIQEN